MHFSLRSEFLISLKSLLSLKRKKAHSVLASSYKCYNISSLFEFVYVFCTLISNFAFALIVRSKNCQKASPSFLFKKCRTLVLSMHLICSRTSLHDRKSCPLLKILSHFIKHMRNDITFD